MCSPRACTIHFLWQVCARDACHAASNMLSTLLRYTYGKYAHAKLVMLHPLQHAHFICAFNKMPASTCMLSALNPPYTSHESCRYTAQLPALVDHTAVHWTALDPDGRHFGPPSNAPRQLAGLLRPLCGLSEACLLSSYGLPKAT